jgi:hypothetical protein
LTAQHPELGKVVAAYDRGVHHVLAAVQASRFSATLSPYRSRADAYAALDALGAVDIGAGR